MKTLFVALLVIFNIGVCVGAQKDNTKGTSMEKAIEMSGFFAAHAIWSVSDGEILIPIFAYQKSDGKREMLRLDSENIEDGVTKGKNYLEKNENNATNAVLLYDGFVTLETGKTDAIILETWLYDNPTKILKMIVPYRNANSPNGFKVYRPKFAEMIGYQNPPFEQLAESFFKGVDTHEKGAAVWNSHIDQSK